MSQFDYTFSVGGQNQNWTRLVLVNGTSKNYTHGYDDAYRLTSRTGATPNYKERVGDHRAGFNFR